MANLLLNTKEDLLASLGCQEVTNYGKFFMVSDVSDSAKDILEGLEHFVYDHNMKTSNIAYFSLLVLDKGIYVGEPNRARKLQATYGGDVLRTEYRHIAEFKWVCPEENLPLDKDEVIKIVFEMV